MREAVRKRLKAYVPESVTYILLMIFAISASLWDALAMELVMIVSQSCLSHGGLINLAAGLEGLLAYGINTALCGRNASPLYVYKTYGRPPDLSGQRSNTL